MNNFIEVKDILIGDGKPKICIPIIGKNDNEIFEELEKIKTYEEDLIEIRIDFYEKKMETEKVINLLKNIREKYSKPILYTFRSKEEGGAEEISEEAYFDLKEEAIKSGYIDIVDLELFRDRENLKRLIQISKENNVKTIISNHDMEKTPAREEIIKRILLMQDLDGDITKVAYMPKSEEDVIELVLAAIDIKNRDGDRPSIMISMGKLGRVTRVFADLLGSSVIFASSKEDSAPGQMNINDLTKILNRLNKKPN